MKKDKIVTAADAPAVGHRLITLAPDQPERTVNFAADGASPFTSVVFRPDEQHVVVVDGSPDDGIPESHAQSLINNGTCVYVKRGEFAPTEERIADAVPPLSALPTAEPEPQPE